MTATQQTKEFPIAYACPELREAVRTLEAIAVEAVWIPNAAKAVPLAQAATALLDLYARLPRVQDLRVFEAPVAAWYNALRSSFQEGDAPLCDITKARLAQASQLLQLVRGQTGTGVDPADPWRGLYDPARLPARDGHGEVMCHPDVPAWADGRESSLLPLFYAQGFDLVVVEAEFEEESVGTGVYANTQRMIDWNPEAPGPDWRLVWLGETEDGLAAWFVRPLAIAALETMGARA
ncbi:hypothetical protein C1929_07635 [Stenotrophomonas sp. ZAC14D1_NAIMI4_6]|uniref:hypothetical protein n=1 Tax=unclassified Stenotrophomonas maltophilia group TaxID=2961925 RepID=UPI000D53E775|nr:MULTISPECIES: hypothetical protein [unclassified Stenotrophomonas maltophilia group]AWH36631.1 hypothetical protein C1929_07635 [Stenotrophomonas sp. ZAC14D1_NAIMI4_6]AWH40821.1 hypothetical protein C1927_07960 [Stenotrophomonas sp. ZAC14D1_NAIMI4_1]